MIRLLWVSRLPRVFAAGLFLLGLFSTTTLPAQDADEDENMLEEVIITGSRIRQDPLDQRLPVLTLTQEDFRATGVTSLADFVQRLPISGSAINGSNNSSETSASHQMVAVLVPVRRKLICATWVPSEFWCWLMAGAGSRAPPDRVYQVLST